MDEVGEAYRSYDHQHAQRDPDEGQDQIQKESGQDAIEHATSESGVSLSRFFHHGQVPAGEFVDLFFLPPVQSLLRNQFPANA